MDKLAEIGDLSEEETDRIVKRVNEMCLKKVKKKLEVIDENDITIEAETKQLCDTTVRK